MPLACYRRVPMKTSPVMVRMVCLWCVGGVSAVACAQSLLVVNQGDATVSVVNPATGSAVATIAENTPGVHGHEVAVTQDGRTAFVPVYGSAGVGRPGVDGHEILVIDVPSRKIVGHVDFGHGVRPHEPVLDPTGRVLYVTTEMRRSVSVVDAHSYKVVGSIPTGQDESHMLAISSDGKRGYTANVAAGTVSVLDLAARKTLAVIPVSGSVQRISVSNDNKYVFTSDQTQPRLAVIDAATNKVANWVALPGTGYGTASTTDGRWLLVAVPSTNEVAVVDLGAMKVVRRIAVPPKPQEVLIAPDGKSAYVSCNVSGKVAVIDLANWDVRSTITAGPMADGMAWVKP